jgi:hypothetical protein
MESINETEDRLSMPRPSLRGRAGLLLYALVAAVATFGWLIFLGYVATKFAAWLFFSLFG